MLRAARQHLVAGLAGERRAVALSRFAQHGPRLLALWQSLYPDDAPARTPLRADSHLVALLRVMHEAIAARPAALAALDAARPADWLDHAELIGYAAYVDRFAGTLRGVAERVPYLQALGIGYLHLLPFLKARAGDNDGGFAVSDYGQVEPVLGSNDDLRRLSEHLRAAGISLAADFVLNHCADDHAWACAARAGDARARSLFHFYDKRDDVERIAANLSEVFPQTAPGNFTWVPEIQAWAWTTFNAWQWDLNWANPEVFREMAAALMHLGNLGVEIFRLDSTAYLWKEEGTDCRNRPQVHLLLRALRAALDIVMPAVALKAEVIEPMARLPAYFGDAGEDARECQIAYHSSAMAAAWAALANQRADILADVIAHTPALPHAGVWLQYVRCHDDIGWWVLAEEARRLGFDLAFTSRFLAGTEPGSYAEGAAFQSSDDEGFHGSNGMTASLVGLHRALAAGDATALQSALRRHWLLYALVLALPGIPLLYMGDECGLGNVADARKWGADADGRWLHRPMMDFALAMRAPFARLRDGIDALIRARVRCPALRPRAPVRLLPSPRPAVLCLQRDTDFLGVFNFGAQEVAIDLDACMPGAASTGSGWRDLVADTPCSRRHKLPGFGFLWALRA